MRIVLQRVKKACVTVEGVERARIATGLVCLIGFAGGDERLPGNPLWSKMIAKITGLRIFPDKTGNMNLSVREYTGEILLVPQFTLYADCRRGRRPGFSAALEPVLAASLFERFVSDVRDCESRAQAGVFGAEMDVQFINWGPVTIILDSAYF
ncbi:MAG: D-aminoacyl-tRNA deacylase [Thermodesulfobacteriota bacterium]